MQIAEHLELREESITHHRSRYDEPFTIKDMNAQDEEDELPLSRIQHSSQRLQSAKASKLTED